MITPDDLEVINAFLGGKKRKEIAAERGTTVYAVDAKLKRPDVKDELRRRMAAIADRVVSFKMRAFDGAEGALEKLITLSSSANTQELQRLASIDVVKIAGLMPRKRILVEKNETHGIDEDTLDFFKQVMEETNMNVVDAEP